MTYPMYEIWEGLVDGQERVINTYEREIDAERALNTYRATDRYCVEHGFQPRAYWIEVVE